MPQYTRYDEIYHHGIKGMHWGIRRYQNEDGSLTEAGQRHYDVKERRMAVKAERVQQRHQIKMQKLQNKAAVKITNASLKKEAKENRRNLKMQKKIDKYAVEKADLELKKMKEDIAYQKGKRFGEKFLPAFAENFGRTFGAAAGQAMGDMANIQKWQETKTRRIDAKSKKLEAKNRKKQLELDEEKLESGFEEKEQAIRELNAKNTKYANETNRLTAETNKQKQDYDLSKEGRERAKYRAETERIEKETARTKANTESRKADFDMTEQGQAITRQRLTVSGQEAAAKIVGAEAARTKAEASKIEAEGKKSALKTDAQANKIRAEAEKIDKQNQTRTDEQKLWDSRNKHMERMAEIEASKLADNNRVEVAKLQEQTKQAKQQFDFGLESQRILKDQNIKITDLNNKSNLAAAKDYWSKNTELEKFKAAASSPKLKPETRRSIERRLNFAARIRNSPNATKSQKAMANGYLASIRSLESYYDDLGVALNLNIDSIIK